MSAHKDLDRLIQSFLAEGPLELPDPSFDQVRDRIEQTRQRAVFGPWRMPTMNKLAPIGLGAAALVAVLLVGSQLFGSPGNTGGPGVEPTTTPEPSVAEPTPTPTPTPEGLLVGSSYRLLDEGGVRITVTVPAPGWGGDAGIMVKNDHVAPPDGAGMITFAGFELYVYGNPCEWSTTKPETPARTVDELVAALSAQASRDASAPVDITVGGYAGKSITLHVPDDAAYSAEKFTDCDQGYFGSWGSPTEPTPYRYHQGPGQIDELWILDVDGVLTVIDTAYYVGTPVEHVEEIRAIVKSATFE